MCDVEAPGEEPGQGVGGRQRRGRIDIGPEDRNADGAAVEPERVCSDHVPVDAAVPTLVDGAEPIDQKVVADVVPAVRLDVVELDRANDGRRFGLCVVVRAGGVMDDGESHVVRILGRALPNRLVRVPLRAGDDRRHRRTCRDAHHGFHRATHEKGP